MRSMASVEHYLFGAGGAGLNALRYYRRHLEITGVVDNAAERYPAGLAGLPVLTPERLPLDRVGVVLIATMYYVDVYAQLATLGVPTAQLLIVPSYIRKGYFLCATPLDDARKALSRALGRLR